MSDRFHLRCTGCGATASPSLRVLECDACGAPYDVEYSYPPDGRRPRLPLERPDECVSLGEGGTPLVELRRLAAELRLGRLWAKLEFQSPTGAFKDRGAAVLMSAAREHGVNEFVEDSSGNAGASLAAYAASVGIRANIFVPASAARGKKNQIAVFGARLHEIEGPRQAATDAARRYVAETGQVWLSHNLSPYFAEGLKSFAFELASSPAAGAGHIVIPVGNGSLVTGAYRGFLELSDSGRGGVMPKLHCVQSEAIRPVVAALNGESWRMTPGAATIAGGIAVSDPPRRAQVVGAVRASGGAGAVVPDTSITAWQRRLAASEGIFCEATSAAAFAGLEALLQSGALEPGDEVVVPVTGSGLKE